MIGEKTDTFSTFKNTTVALIGGHYVNAGLKKLIIINKIKIIKFI